MIDRATCPLVIVKRVTRQGKKGQVALSSQQSPNIIYLNFIFATATNIHSVFFSLSLPSPFASFLSDE